MLMCCTMAQAQDDPTIMVINGQPVSRSEFEYSYNKNNSESVIDKKSIEEYADLFVNYKLKVAAAINAGIDTTQAFKQEFLSYRDQQVRPTMINDTDVENEARRIYEETRSQIDANGGLINPAHILIAVKQKAPEAEVEAARLRADSIYSVLKNGGDFATLARQLSDDKQSGAKGGELGWIQKGVTVKEFEDAAFALKTGETSAPVLSPFGYHIIKMMSKQNFFPYDSVRTNIMQFIEARGIREKIIDDKLDHMVAEQGGNTTRQSLLDQKVAEMQAADPDLKNLIREYHDGLLLYEISNRNVWEKASKDEEGLARYFNKNKKKYTWESPRFKGIAYHTKDQADINAVKKSIKGVAYDQWAEKLRTTFNADSVIRIRVEKGIFKPGDNKLVDKEVFKKNVEVKPMKDYPYDSTFGKMLKKPENYQDVRGLVVADYQDELEKEWVAQLRKTYPVVINKEILATVNKH